MLLTKYSASTRTVILNPVTAHTRLTEENIMPVCLTLAMQQDERERNEKERNEKEKDMMILPGPVAVKAARQEIDFSQESAARLVHSTAGAWRKWEAHHASDEYRQISGAHWELFIRKTDSLREKGSRFKLRHLTE
jgi:DNA-binding transcriptional regulator YiaG